MATDPVSEVAAAIERDLLGRFERAAPLDRIFIERLSTIAAWTLRLDGTVRNHGADPRAANAHTGMTERLLKGLVLLGTDRIAGTVAEQILTRAVTTQGALLSLCPVAGHA